MHLMCLCTGFVNLLNKTKLQRKNVQQRQHLVGFRKILAVVTEFRFKCTCHKSELTQATELCYNFITQH